MSILTDNQRENLSKFIRQNWPEITHWSDVGNKTNILTLRFPKLYDAKSVADFFDVGVHQFQTSFEVCIPFQDGILGDDTQLFESNPSEEILTAAQKDRIERFINQNIAGLKQYRIVNSSDGNIRFETSNESDTRKISSLFGAEWRVSDPKSTYSSLKNVMSIIEAAEINPFEVQSAELSKVPSIEEFYMALKNCAQQMGTFTNQSEEFHIVEQRANELLIKFRQYGMK